MWVIKERIEIYRQQILRLRREFTNLESQRAQAPPNEQAKFSQEIVDLCLQIDRIEASLWRINRGVIQELNQLRSEIVADLEQFNHWRMKMREMEKLFLVNFVRPGFILKQAVRQREYLEDAYQRLHKGIVTQKINSLNELESEISKTLNHADNAYEADQRSLEDEAVKERNLWEIAKNLDPQQIVEQVDDDQIRRDFKKIVLPAVHPDTSNTPVETFLTVKEVYEEGDYLLMEAYVAQYRGEIEVDEAEDVLEVQDHLGKRVRSYHRLSERLNRKLNALKKELTPEELEDPEKVRKLLIDQRDDIRNLIQVETEKIFELRNKIQDLVQFFLNTQQKGNT
jgi:hypothetical protein